MSWGIVNQYRAIYTSTLILPNILPVANAGPDIEGVFGGVNIFLEGSATDADFFYPFTYSWVQVGGPEVVLFNADEATAYFVGPTYTEDVEYVFELTVFDGLGFSLPDSVTVLVKTVSKSIADISMLCIADGTYSIKLWSEFTDKLIYAGNVSLVKGKGSVVVAAPPNEILSGRWLGDTPPVTGTGLYLVTR